MEELEKCICDIIMQDSKSYEYELVQKNGKQHMYFIVGRGRNSNVRSLISEDASIKDMNIIYIDLNPEMRADIQSSLDAIKFDELDLPNDIDIRFIFDWSTFYCSAIYAFKEIAKQLKRKFMIYVPLYIDEKKIPNEIKREFIDPPTNFKVEIIEGLYPLFDWNKKTSNGHKVSSYINPNLYVVIKYDFKA